MKQLGFEDRTKYILTNEEFGDLNTIEPIGWNEDEKELKRSDDLFGVFTNLSNNLKFVGDAYNYISSIYDLAGIEADIILTKYERNGYTDEWEVSYRGYLDLTTYTLEDNKLSVKFNESGFYKKIQNRKNIQFEMQRPDTADGVALPDMRIDRIALPIRKIQLINSAVKGDLRVSDLYIMDGNIPTYYTPTTKDSVASSESFSTIDSIKVSQSNGFNASNAFYVNAKGTIKARFSFTMRGWLTQNIYGSLTNHSMSYELQLIKFLNVTDYTQQDVLYTFVTWSGSPDSNNDIKYWIDFTLPETQITLTNGQGLAIAIKSTKLSGANSFTHYNTTLDKYDMLWIEDSEFIDSPYLNYKILLPFETAERLIAIMTGRLGALHSTFLGRTDIDYEQDGKGSLCGITSGFWVRGFETIGVDKTYHLTTSFDDFLKSFMAVYNIGMGLEYARGSERVVIEELDYFFGEEISIIIPEQVSKVKRNIADKLHFASLEFGYDFAGNYEEATGLDEYNIKNTYTTCITKTDNKYDKISKYRADSYGIEFARRKPAAKFGTEDTRYDKDNFLVDMKRSLTEVFETRLWDDDLKVLPTGVYSPETAYNLKLSPMNNLIRHSWYLKAGLEKYLDKFIRYSSTEGNSSLVTEPNELSFALQENGTLQNNLLARSLINPIWIEFEYPLDRDLAMQVFGKTNGKQNYYGLVQFINEKNEIEFGYLWDLKPNKEGKWKLLKANKLTFN